jgi:hypothetical protein
VTEQAPAAGSILSRYRDNGSLFVLSPFGPETCWAPSPVREGRHPPGKMWERMADGRRVELWEGGERTHTYLDTVVDCAADPEPHISRPFHRG